MRRAELRFLAFALTLILAACGEVRWHKPGVDDASLAKDLADCRTAAHSSIQRMYGAPLPPTGGSGVFGGTSFEPSAADRQIREQEAVNRCMREKSYTLITVEK